MSSLAMLAHGGHAKAPPFNAIFYATVATVIPVLFVAAALQADVYTEMINSATSTARRLQGPEGRSEGIRPLIAVMIGTLIAGLIVVFGVWGEIQAFLDLYLQHPVGLVGPLNAVGPLIAVTALALAAAIGPARKVASLYHDLWVASAPREEPPSPGETDSPAGRDGQPRRAGRPLTLKPRGARPHAPAHAAATTTSTGTRAPRTQR
jgi:hypothetical protein